MLTSIWVALMGRCFALLTALGCKSKVVGGSEAIIWNVARFLEMNIEVACATSIWVNVVPVYAGTTKWKLRFGKPSPFCKHRDEFDFDWWSWSYLDEHTADVALPGGALLSSRYFQVCWLFLNWTLQVELWCMLLLFSRHKFSSWYGLVMMKHALVVELIYWWCI